MNRKGYDLMINDFSIINPNRYKDVMPKNSVKIGYVGKKMYVANLRIVISTSEKKGTNRREVFTVHTLITKQGEEVQEYGGKIAKDLFSKMIFY